MSYRGPGPWRYPGGAWCNWSEDHIFAENPDWAIVAKMLEVAGRLGARVQGDHGKFHNWQEHLP